MRAAVGGAAAGGTIALCVEAYRRRHFASPRFEPAATKDDECNPAALQPDSALMCAARTIAIGGTMKTARLYMQVLNETRIENADIFQAAYDQRAKTPLLTVGNHASVLDDPFVLGLFLPQRYDFSPDMHRWSVCKAPQKRLQSRPKFSRFCKLRCNLSG